MRFAQIKHSSRSMVLDMSEAKRSNYMKIFDMVSPLDFRYYGYDRKLFEKLKPFVSEEAFIKYQLKVEATLVKVMAREGICSEKIANEIEKACAEVTPEEVYIEEKRIKHVIRALVNCIRSKVSKEAKPYVHLSVTSADITDTATALRLKDLFNKVILPDLLHLEKLLIDIARETSGQIQIGRTHGKHAVPITFGFAIAKYVSRLGNRIETIKQDVDNLKGKISGAVGAYNAASLIFDSPEAFEKEVLAELGLKPSTHSTQIVEPQFVTDLACSVVSCFSVLANLADDFRHLQRSEIQEIEELKEKEKVGSSTMPHKINPWDFEHVKSMWKAFMPRVITVFMDEISEHQRDLTNSASSRFLTELFVAFDHSVNWLADALTKVNVNEKNIRRNFEQSKAEFVAEPLYILLAMHGHHDAYDYARKLAAKARDNGRRLTEIIWEDKNIRSFLDKMTDEQKAILRKPERYIGLSKSKTEAICSFWEASLLL
jgi:adenylosuccinate lyase